MKRWAGSKGRWIILLIVVVAAAGAGLVTFLQQPKSTPKTLANIASLSEMCDADSSVSEMSCQQTYYKASYEEKGLEATFADLRKEYETNDSIKSNCHQLTHTIGRAAAIKHGDVAGAYAEGDEFCWSGYYHGVMEGILQKLDDATVASKLNTICQSLKDEAPYSFKHYNCVHGLGHGIMLIEADELFVSLEVCDNLTDSWERESCYGGVFMENIMAHNNPDHSTKYIRADDPLYPCTAVAEPYRNQCYAMQTSHSLAVLGRDYAKVFSLCSQIDAKNQNVCYQSLGRDASGNSISDPAQTYDICMQGPNPAAQENCVIGAVKDFISYHHSDQQAGVLCDKFEPGLAATCHKTKQEYYTNF